MMTILDPVSVLRIMLVCTLMTGGVVIAAAFFQRIFPGAAASIRHAVWLGTIVIALVLPLAAIIVPLQWGARFSGLERTVRVDRSVDAEVAAELAVPEPEPSMITIEQSAAENGARVFVLIWLVGLGGVVLHLANSARRLQAVLGSARPVNDRVLAEYLPANCEDVAIRQSGRIELPLTAGIVRPLILLPEGAVGSWSNRRMRAALLHELAHVRRRDVAWQIAGRVACALHWFNPLVWYAARQCARAAEQSCDDAVLDAGVRPSSYAGHLLEIARWAAQRNEFALAVGQGSELEGRITAVLSPVRARRGLSRRALQRIAWAAALAAVALGTHRTLRPGDALAEASESRITGRSGQAVDDALVRLLDDVDPEVRAAAARSAGELQIQSAIQPLLRALQDRHPQVRLRAAHSLGELENSGGIAGLHRALLTDPDVNVRREAASALGEIENDAAASALTDALGRAQSANLRRHIIRALGDTGSSTALPVLEALIGGHDEQMRRTALEALTQLQSPEATRLLLQATSSENPDTRRVAARAIADAHR